jgi:hypothetical protein
MNLKFLRAFWNAAFIGGLALLIVSSGPLIIFGILQQLGYFPGNNGLGLGLWFFLTIWPALGFLVAGVVIGVKHVDGSAGKGRAA